MFPQRHAEPLIAHSRVALMQNFKSACVVCSELYSKKKAEGEELQWDKFVKRTKMVCGYCTENSGKKKSISPFLHVQEHPSTSEILYVITSLALNTPVLSILSR